MKNAYLSRAGHLAAVAALSFVVTSATAMEGNPLFSATRIEVDTGRASGSKSIQAGRAEGWIGGDYHRFVWKAEATREAGRLDDAEVQALYGRYLAPFWELQTGLRFQGKPESHTYAALGVRGLAPYAFDVDLALFVRSDGKVFARTRAEYDLLWTNRLICRPFVFADWSGSNIRVEDTRRGVETYEVGINTRYEITRAFAPYIEVAHSKRYALGASNSSSSVRLGIRLLF